MNNITYYAKGEKDLPLHFLQEKIFVPVTVSQPTLYTHIYNRKMNKKF